MALLNDERTLGKLSHAAAEKIAGQVLLKLNYPIFQGLFAKQPAAWSLHMTIVSGVNRTGRQDEASKNHNNSNHGNLLV